MQRDAGCEFTIALREQQAAFGRSIVAGEFSKFFVEVLETQAEA
jgi:hypothetical protein